MAVISACNERVTDSPSAVRCHRLTALSGRIRSGTKQAGDCWEFIVPFWGLVHPQSPSDDYAYNFATNCIISE